MAIIIGVKFRTAQKIYYFDPDGVPFDEHDNVIVETIHGVEFGEVVVPNKDVPDEELVAPLKKIMRKATDSDKSKNEQNLKDKDEAIETMKEKAESLGLDMKIVDAQFTFDRHKLLFFFTAPGRVDFRELVKILAGIYKTRIELRQIYERDDVKLRGSFGPCGRECCCASFLPDFAKVSIKMAKIQGLSLNPQKISGVCGRLMCCLKFENDYYNEVFKLMPKVGSTVQTPDGEGTVISNDILKKISSIKVQTKDGDFDIRQYNLEDLGIKEKQTIEESAGDDDDIIPPSNGDSY